MNLVFKSLADLTETLAEAKLNLVPTEPTEAMLRPFYSCPPDELPLAYEAMLAIVKADGEIPGMARLLAERELPCGAVDEPSDAKALAWQQVRNEVGVDGWTVGEAATYYGFFGWGWDYRGKLESQRGAPGVSAAPGADSGCATEQDCTHLPWCRIDNKCHRRAQPEPRQSLASLRGVLSKDNLIPDPAKEEADNYSRILTLLGMEEEGDPVAEVARLVAAPPTARVMTAALEALETAESEMRDWHFEHPARKQISAAIEALKHPDDGKSGEWYCEDHPEHLMGHDGCTGAGLPECARISMLARLLKISRQAEREANTARDEMAAHARRLAAPPPMAAGLGEPTRSDVECWEQGKPDSIARAMAHEEGLAETPTPKPQEGTWALTAPDGRVWTADSPLRACGAELRSRVPADVALARIFRAASPAQPIGFVRPDEVSPGWHVFINFHEGRNTALPWRPVYAAPSANQGVTIPVRFDILYEYAQKCRVDYGHLCRTVRDAIAEGSRAALGRMPANDASDPAKVEEAFYALAESRGWDSTSGDGVDFEDDNTQEHWQAWLAGVAFAGGEGVTEPSGDSATRSGSHELPAGVAVGCAQELLEALKAALPRLAHKLQCYSVRPATEWPEHGSVSFDGCQCEIKLVKAAIAKATGEAA